ncbi:MAG: acyl-CoA dehydrogenase family protein [Dehalococcoidia bacterium]
MTEPVSRTSTALLEAAYELSAQAASAADQIEQERRLPERLVRAIAEAGLFRMLVPASLGGSETDLITFASVIEQIARGDASTAWCICQAAGSALVAAWMDRDAARCIFSDPRAVVARGVGSGTAVAVEGGYRLSGRWSFASGCHHATWLEGSGTLIDQAGRQHRREDGSPDGRSVLFPASCAQFEDVWHVSGLRGTGSDSYTVTDLFVPEANVIRWATRRTETGPLYAFPSSSVYATGFASVAMGIARGSLDAFVGLAQQKRPRGATRILRDSAVVHAQVARAEAGLRSARAFLHEAVRDAWEHATATGTLAIADRVLVRLAATHAIHAAAQVVDAMYHAAGATAIFSSNLFERRFRDVNAVTQQIQANQTHFETVGQFFLGLEPDMDYL